MTEASPLESPWKVERLVLRVRVEHGSERCCLAVVVASCTYSYLLIQLTTTEPLMEALKFGDCQEDSHGECWMNERRCKYLEILKIGSTSVVGASASIAQNAAITNRSTKRQKIWNSWWFRPLRQSFSPLSSADSHWPDVENVNGGLCQSKPQCYNESPWKRSVS